MTINRTVIQLTMSATDHDTAIIALCNDGTLWMLTKMDPKWTELPSIPAKSWQAP